MALKDANVAITVGGDTSALRKDLKKGSTSLDKFGRNAKSAMSSVAKMGAAAAVAAAAVSSALFVAATKTAKEIDNLSRVAGVSTKTFQQMANGAKLYGVEQDKLADILKDTQDKVGDFLQTGGGAMADYFENIAPKIGQTAEEFRNLSGSQALQKYVNGLQQANLSQSEMTFYMEAIASDATNLLPLLKDNGDELNRMTKEMGEFGGVLSEVEIVQLKEANKAFTEIGIVVKNVINKVMARFAPVVTVIAEKLKKATKESVDFANVGVKAFGAVAKAVGYVGNAIRGIQVIFKGMQIVFDAVIGGILEKMISVVELFDNMTKHVIGNLNQIIRGFNKLPKINIDEIIVGENKTLNKLQVMQDAVFSNMQKNVADMKELFNEPLPSETVNNFLNEVNKAAEEAAKVKIGKDNPADEESKLEEKSLQEKFERQKAYFENMRKSKQEFNNKTLEDIKAFNDAQEKLEKQRFKNGVQGFSKMFSDLSSLMNTENKKQFEIGKVAAMAGAAVDGVAAAISSYKFGASVGGPILGASFAAASALATGNMINNLRKQSFGGGGGGGNAAAGAAVTPQSVSTTNISSAPNVSVTINGNADQSTIDQFAELINSGAVPISPDSEQGRALRSF